jgi:hypothetical protein
MASFIVLDMCFSLVKVLDGRRDMGGGQVEAFGEPVLGADFAELVVDADPGEPARRAGFGQRLRDGGSERAALLVVLAGD